MPDGTKSHTRTGELRQLEERHEPPLLREATRPKSVPELPDELGSTTGVMPVHKEPGDPSASREENKPL